MVQLGDRLRQPLLRFKWVVNKEIVQTICPRQCLTDFRSWTVCSKNSHKAHENIGAVFIAAHSFAEQMCFRNKPLTGEQLGFIVLLRGWHCVFLRSICLSLASYINSMHLSQLVNPVLISCGPLSATLHLHFLNFSPMSHHCHLSSWHWYFLGLSLKVWNVPGIFKYWSEVCPSGRIWRLFLCFGYHN